ncbi:MAG: AarF/UbiB family protein, partial [Myxococcota bacterium]|nr:AarF/UbiB family protein [Myxococcota bacterium]
MLRKGRLARLSRLGEMAVGFVGDAAGAGTRLATATSKAAATEFHERAARRMLEVFGEMKGLPLKAGQMLSYIDEILPPEHREIYNEMLGQLRRHAPPMEWVHICEVFHEEFDGREPDDIFGRFDPEAIAAASIGQVYRGALHDGTEVAIKVQYPGIAEAIRSDLDN